MKGILFTEILFNKTIRKEKTMTRREHGLKVINNHQSDFIGFYHPVEEYFYASNGKGIDLKIAPTYKAGEVVYIKEPVAEYHYKVFRDGMAGNSHKPAYRYGMPDHQAVTYDGSTPRIIPRDGLKFQNKMFVGSDKARYYIRITSVKVERLYDISDEDCLKEGIDVDKAPYRDDFFYDYQENDYSYISPQKSFFSLFRFANRVPKSKEIPNSWVFCYSYCLCDINGNEL